MQITSDYLIVKNTLLKTMVTTYNKNDVIHFQCATYTEVSLDDPESFEMYNKIWGNKKELFSGAVEGPAFSESRSYFYDTSRLFTSIESFAEGLILV